MRLAKRFSCSIRVNNGIYGVFKNQIRIIFIIEFCVLIHKFIDIHSQVGVGYRTTCINRLSSKIACGG